MFYYYQTFAKTLSVIGDDQFTDAAGAKHDWRKDLAEKLFSLPEGERELGQHRRPLDGRGPEPDDLLLADGSSSSAGRPVTFGL